MKRPALLGLSLFLLFACIPHRSAAGGCSTRKASRLQERINGDLGQMSQLDSRYAACRSAAGSCSIDDADGDLARKLILQKQLLELEPRFHRLASDCPRCWAQDSFEAVTQGGVLSDLQRKLIVTYPIDEMDQDAELLDDLKSLPRMSRLSRKPSLREADSIRLQVFCNSLSSSCPALCRNAIQGICPRTCAEAESSIAASPPLTQDQAMSECRSRLREALAGLGKQEDRVLVPQGGRLTLPCIAPLPRPEISFPPPMLDSPAEDSTGVSADKRVPLAPTGGAAATSTRSGAIPR